jgi:hypothetical protein
LYGSNDNISFTQIDDVSVDQGAIMTCTALSSPYVADSPDSYLFYRFEFEMSSVNTYSLTGVTIGEIDFEE